MAVVDLRGHLEVIEHLQANLLDQQDVDSVLNIERLCSDIHAGASEREDLFRASIRSLTEEVARWQERVDNPHDALSLSQQRAELEQRATESEQQVQRLGDSAQRLAAEAASSQAECAMLNAEAAADESYVRDEEQRIRHEVSLFANISQIRWHYEQHAAVRGTYASKDGAVRHFEFDPASHSATDIADSLWGMME